MINKPRVKKLVAALRSGKYKQATGQLRSRDGGFCCLGVACDVYRKAEGGKWDSVTFLGARVAMPDAVTRWFGFADGNPTLKTRKNLAIENDDGKTFAEIADLIEENFL